MNEVGRCGNCGNVQEFGECAVCGVMVIREYDPDFDLPTDDDDDYESYISSKIEEHERWLGTEAADHLFPGAG